MPASCAAYGCTNRFRKGSNIQFFGFPLKRENILKEWVKALRRKNFTPTTATKICSSHFLPSDYLDRPGINVPHLKPEAVPSVFNGFPKYYQPNPKKRRTLLRNNVSSSTYTQQDNQRQQAEEAVVFCNTEQEDENEIEATRLCQYEDAAIQTDETDVDRNAHIRRLESEISRLRKKNKLLQQRVRRNSGQIKSLKQLVSALKKKDSDSESIISIEELEYDDSTSESEVDESLNDNEGADWKDIPNIIEKEIGAPLSEYNGYSGVKESYISLLADAEVGEFFDVFIDDNIIEMIVNETNHYATCELTKSNVDVKRKSRLHLWQPTNKNEMRKFLGIVLYMGLVQYPKISDYWSTNPFYRNLFVPTIMSRNRFQTLLRFIHFSSNDENEEGKLRKVRPLIEKLNENFMKVYEPGKVLTIDESLVPFKGRLQFKQYIKNKSHRYGVKLFKLNSGHGYTHKLEVYAGKSENRLYNAPQTVVMRLAEEILNSGRTLCVDNWYSSVNLANNLLNQRTHLVGTIRKNRRGVPRDLLFHTKLKKNEFLAAKNKNGVTILNWKDKRNVYMISTKHSLQMVEEKTRKGIKVRPKMIRYYNKSKKSTDLSDQMASYNSPLRKSIKWYRKLAFELLLNTALVNSHIIYKKVKNVEISITKFREMIVHHLIKPLDDHNANENESSEDTPPPTSKNIHKLEAVKQGNKRQNYKLRRQCKTCYRKLSEKYGRKIAQNKAKKVVTFCTGCEGNPFYCIQCFNTDHQSKKKK